MADNKKTYGFSLLDKTTKMLDQISQITGLNRSQVVDKATKMLFDDMIQKNEIVPSK